MRGKSIGIKLVSSDERGGQAEEISSTKIFKYEQQNLMYYWTETVIRRKGLPIIHRVSQIIIGHSDIESTRGKTILRNTDEFVFIGSIRDVFDRFMYRHPVGS